MIGNGQVGRWCWPAFWPPPESPPEIAPSHPNERHSPSDAAGGLAPTRGPHVLGKSERRLARGRPVRTKRESAGVPWRGTAGSVAILRKKHDTHSAGTVRGALSAVGPLGRAEILYPLLLCAFICPLFAV